MNEQLSLCVVVVLGIVIRVRTVRHHHCSGDTIGAVKTKLTCLAVELAKAKQDNARLEAENASLKAAGKTVTPEDNPGITWWGSLFDKEDLTPEKCKSRATEAVSDRGGIVRSHGDVWISFAIGKTTAVVLCQAPRTGYVLVSDHGSLQHRLDLSTALSNAIFP